MDFIDNPQNATIAVLRKNRKPIARSQPWRICCWLKVGLFVLAMGLATSLSNAQKIPTNEILPYTQTDHGMVIRL
jgi:hypothetical protein